MFSFEKSLTDLIRGLRAHKRDEAAFVRGTLKELAVEAAAPDPAAKCLAITKLSYLHMLGYDASWAAFHVIEVMASSDISYKRIGYLAASYSFTQDTPVLMLATNLIKKDLSSTRYQEAAIALHTLAMIVTPELARDLLPDILGLLKHSQPSLRKRAVLVLFRMFVKWPEGLKAGLPKLQERLSDPEPTVVAAAVNVICELATRTPRTYLPLAPTLYGLLTSIQNNWVLIKLVKLFSALAPLEPRLVKKLVPPLVQVISKTTAVSLLLESIKALVVGEMLPDQRDPLTEEDARVLELVASKMKLLLANEDPNIKCLSLDLLSKLLILRPELSKLYSDTVLASLEEIDEKTRCLALDILCSMVNPDNFGEIVQRLMLQVVPSDAPQGSTESLIVSAHDPIYRDGVAHRILDMVIEDTYSNVQDFEWVVSILFELGSLPDLTVGPRISNVLLDLCVRVPDLRPYTVNAAVKILTLTDDPKKERNAKRADGDILYASSWIVGEYNGHLESFSPDLILRLTAASVIDYKAEVQSVFLQASLKLLTAWLGTGRLDWASFEVFYVMYKSQVSLFLDSSFMEVCERACIFVQMLDQLVTMCQSIPVEERIALVYSSLSPHFQDELYPVIAEAQKLVPRPENLDLESWIGSPFPTFDQALLASPSDSDTDAGVEADRKEAESLASFIEMDAKARKAIFDPYYISDKKPDTGTLLDVDSIPIVQLSLDSTQKSPENVIHDIADLSLQPSLKKKPFKVQKSVMLPAGITLDQVEASQQKSQKKSDGLSKSGNRSFVVDEESMALQSVVVALGESDQRMRESRSYTPLDDSTAPKKTKKKKKTTPKEEEGTQNGNGESTVIKKKIKKRESDPNSVREPRDSFAP